MKFGNRVFLAIPSSQWGRWDLISSYGLTHLSTMLSQHCPEIHKFYDSLRLWFTYDGIGLSAIGSRVIFAVSRLIQLRTRIEASTLRRQ